MCTCRDYAMWLRFVIQVQAGYIVDLERRMQHREPAVIDLRRSGRRVSFIRGLFRP